MEYRNDSEIWVYHLKRGGGHAVLSWIARNSDRQVFHLNNALSKPLKARWRGEKVFRRITDSKRYGGPGVRVFNLDLDPSASYRDVARMPKEVLITNVENFRIDRIAAEPLLGSDAHQIIGRSRRRVTVLVLRDAFNNFASVRRGKRRMRNRLNRFYSIRWKDYAREYLRITSYLPADTIMISFNSWFADESYRRRIAEELGLPHSDRGVDRLSQDGGGSSFSGQEFQDRAREMDVLDRWRNFVDDDDYRSAFDEETVELSNRIFGDITGGAITGRRR
jgi:hypothetical protein